MLGRIERGEVHLSALKQFGRHLDEENVDAVLDEAKGKSRSHLDEMIARRFPRPNAPTVEMPTRTEPLSATGVLLQMTITAEGYANLKRAKELLGHCVPDGDTVKVIERALRTSRPLLVARSSRATASSARIWIPEDAVASAARDSRSITSSPARSVAAMTLRISASAADHTIAAEEIFGKDPVTARISLFEGAPGRRTSQSATTPARLHHAPLPALG